MAFLGVVFLFPERPTPTVGDMDCNAVVLGGVLGLSLAWYYFPKYGGRHWFTGPIANVDTETPVERISQASVDEKYSEQ